MRSFVAIELSPAVRRMLADVQDTLRRQGRGAFPHPQDLHLTLAFLGETDRPAAAQTVLEAVLEGRGLSLTVEGLGCFGDLWWAGVRAGPELERLALNVQASLREAGFPIERRSWLPHITLVRHWRGEAPAVAVPSTGMTVRRVALLESCPPSGGPRYREIWGKTL